jgi:hypothetical protein
MAQNMKQENVISAARQELEKQEERKIYDDIRSGLKDVSDSNFSVKDEFIKNITRLRKAEKEAATRVVNNDAYQPIISNENVINAFRSAFREEFERVTPPPIPIPLPIKMEEPLEGITKSFNSSINGLKKEITKEYSLFEIIKTGLSAAVDILRHTIRILFSSDGLLGDLVKISKEQLELLKAGEEKAKTDFLRGDLDNEPPKTLFQRLGESLSEKLSEAFEKNIMLGNTQATNNTYRVVGGLFGFFGALTRTLLPFMGLIAGGAVIAVLLSSFEFFTEFERTGRAFEQLINGGLMNAIPNLINLFTSVGEDLGGMVQTTERFDRLMSAIGAIFVNQLFPAMKYFADLLSEIVISISDYLQGEGGQQLTAALMDFANFVTDVLIFFFEDVLPPILNTIGFLFRTAEKTLRAMTPAFVFIFAEMFPGMLRAIESIFTDIFGFVDDTIASFTNLFNSDNPIQFASNYADLSSNLGGFLLSTFDNILTFFADIFTIDTALGFEQGTRVSEMLSYMMENIRDYINNFIHNVTESFSTKINEAIEWITNIDPLNMIIDKIQSFITAIVDLIPTPRDIIDFIRSSIDEDSMIGGFILDKLSGLIPEASATVIEAIPNDRPARTVAELEAVRELTQQLNFTSIQAPSAPSAPPSRGASRPSGVPRTTPRMTPSDRVLYGHGQVR